MTTQAPVLSVRGLLKSYQGLRPLRVADLEVAPGDRVALSGFDAVAAEVFVNLLNGAILPDEGEVRVFGRRTSDIGSEQEWFTVLDRFGLVTTRAALLEGFTLRQNLALPFSLEIDEIPPQVDARVRDVAALAGIEEAQLAHPMADAAPHVRMRAHLARALALGPELLVLEHPTSAIGAADVRAFAETVRHAIDTRRLTAIVVTEDADFAAVVARRALRLKPGTGALVDARPGWRRWFGAS